MWSVLPIPLIMTTATPTYHDTATPTYHDHTATPTYHDHSNLPIMIIATPTNQDHTATHLSWPQPLAYLITATPTYHDQSHPPIQPDPPIMTTSRPPIMTIATPTHEYIPYWDLETTLEKKPRSTLTLYIVIHLVSVTSIDTVTIHTHLSFWTFPWWSTSLSCSALAFVQW